MMSVFDNLDDLSKWFIDHGPKYHEIHQPYLQFEAARRAIVNECITRAKRYTGLKSRELKQAVTRAELLSRGDKVMEPLPIAFILYADSIEQGIVACCKALVNNLFVENGDRNIANAILRTQSLLDDLNEDDYESVFSVLVTLYHDLRPLYERSQVEERSGERDGRIHQASYR